MQVQVQVQASARLDWTRLRSCEQHTCSNAAQTRHPQKLGRRRSLVVDFGTALGPRSFGPFSLIGWLPAGCRAQSMQVRDARPVTQALVGLNYSIIRRARDRQDETRDRTMTPLPAGRASCNKQGTVPERQGQERSGGGERGKGVVGRGSRGEVSSRPMKKRDVRFGETRDGEQDGSTETNAADCRVRRRSSKEGGREGRRLAVER